MKERTKELLLPLTTDRDRIAHGPAHGLSWCDDKQLLNFEDASPVNSSAPDHDIRIACTAVVKNEEDYIAEWIAYHIAIGFDTIVVIDNLSTDKTVEIAQAFGEKYDVRIIPSNDSSPSYQRSAYMKAIELFKHDFDWMAFFDIDEFIFIADGRTIKDFICPKKTSAIGINWAIFGSSGHIKKAEGLLIENYTKRSVNEFGPNCHIKSIVRPTYVRDFINGHCFSVDGEYSDANGDLISWNSPGITLNTPDYKGAQLNHYFTRSWQDWEKKLRRGYPDLERKVSEFNDYDRNEVTDERILIHITAVNSILDHISEVKKTAIDQSEIGTVDQISELMTKINSTRSLTSPLINLALRKQANQSSICKWSVGNSTEEDAGRAVDGNLEGVAKFHTDFEDRPWWTVDLGAVEIIHKINIFNRQENLDLARRCINIVIEIGIVPDELFVVLTKNDDIIFGGIDGNPFSFSPVIPLIGRYVKISLIGSGFLHFDQIEVLGYKENDGNRPFDEDKSDREILEHFQSFGDNCEFGGVQRQLGLEKLSLLKWCRTEPSAIIHGLRDRFNNIGKLENVDLIEHLGEYFISDGYYDLSGHTFVKIGSVDAKKFQIEQAQRMKYLARKILEDLESGEYVFLFNSYKNHQQHDINQIIELGDVLKDYGDNYLVWVRSAEMHGEEVGNFKWISQNVLLIHKDNKTTFDSEAKDFLPGWIKICRSAANIVERRRSGAVDANIDIGLYGSQVDNGINKIESSIFISPRREGTNEISQKLVTVVITSCDRYDLLELTLKSFFAFNTCEFIDDIIVVEDGYGDPSSICDKYGAKLVRTNGREGQSIAIDLVYNLVDTPYVFHCEDDWQFYRSGFIERSLSLLEQDLGCVCVWIRAWNDTNGHPLHFRSDNRRFGILDYAYSEIWHGFTWNPSLRRISDMKKVLPVSPKVEKLGVPGEIILSEEFFKMGYHACILDEGGYVRHSGWDRHV